MKITIDEGKSQITIEQAKEAVTVSTVPKKWYQFWKSSVKVSLKDNRPDMTASAEGEDFKFGGGSFGGGGASSSGGW